MDVPRTKGGIASGEWGRRLLAAVAVALFTYYTLAFFSNLDDDAFIPMRYALNFVHGHGWVMNPGERVEAVTSPLLELILTGLLRFFSLDQTIWLAKLGGYGLGLVVLHQTWILGKAVFPRSPWAAAFSVLWLAGRPEFALSMTNCLETGLAVFFVVAGLNRFLSESDNVAGTGFPLSSVLLVFAGLARPELCLLLPGLILVSRRPRTYVLKSLATFVGPLLILLAVRYSFYGDLLPNTFYAKRMPLEEAIPGGAQYLFRYLSLWSPPAYFFILLPVVGLGTIRTGFKEFSVLLVVTVGFNLASSGSWMPDGRFVAPAMPIVAILWVAGIAEAVRIFRSKPIGLAFGTAMGAFLALFALATCHSLNELVGMGSIFDAPMPVPLSRWRCSSMLGRRLMGDWIRGHVPKGEFVACSEMGVPPIMNMDIRFIDFRGLSDPVVARMHTDVTHSNVGVSLDGWTEHGNEMLDYILRRRPYAILAFDGGYGEAAELQSRYRLVDRFVMPENGWEVKAWIRR